MQSLHLEKDVAWGQETSPYVRIVFRTVLVGEPTLPGQVEGTRASLFVSSQEDT